MTPGVFDPVTQGSSECFVSRIDTKICTFVTYCTAKNNSCGTGTWGDGSLVPDPRDLLDATGPSCL